MISDISGLSTSRSLRSLPISEYPQLSPFLLQVSPGSLSLTLPSLPNVSLPGSLCPCVSLSPSLSNSVAVSLNLFSHLLSLAFLSLSVCLYQPLPISELCPFLLKSLLMSLSLSFPVPVHLCDLPKSSLLPPQLPQSLALGARCTVISLTRLVLEGVHGGGT